MADVRRGPAEVGGDDQLPFGGATEVNEAEIPEGDEIDVEALVEDTPESVAAEADGLDVDDEPGGEDDLGDAETFRDFLLGGTQRPNEPLTAGAPFGPGPNSVSRPGETPEQLLKSAARELLGSRTATARVKNLAARMLRGD